MKMKTIHGNRESGVKIFQMLAEDGYEISDCEAFQHSVSKLIL